MRRTSWGLALVLAWGAAAQAQDARAGRVRERAAQTEDGRPAARPAGQAAAAGLVGPAGPRGQLHAVLAKLAGVDALTAHFREEKRMALLAQPLISEGVLHYAKPRLLARHTERPRKASLLLRDEVLTFGDAEHAESIALSAQPALRVLVDTFVSVLGGDLAALERVADVQVEALREGDAGSSAGFRIRVLPKDPKVKRLVRAMAFEGQGATLSRMELVDATGDVTVTTFTRVNLRKAFSPAERAQLFHVGG